MNRKPETSNVLVQWIRDRVRYMHRENQDMVLPINGSEGDGKSTLGLIIGMIADDTFGPETLRERVTWHGDHHLQLARQAPRFAYLQLDEGEGIIASEHSSGTNRRMKRWLYRCRKHNLWQVFILPEFQAVQGTLSSWRADERIETLCKGKAVVKRQGKNGYWKDIFEFEFPSLQGLGIWDAYEDLANDAAAGRHGPGPLSDEPEPESTDAFRELVESIDPVVAPLGRIAIDYVAQQEAK